MSGKSYTMKEMLTIVEFIVANKFYDKIKGRKMWMDLASSQLTMRTWQSLKETFLKRILPDIHNPYYKLTNDQISSFRSGYDVMDRNKNKLDIRTISDDSNSNGHNPTDNEQTININSDEGETTTGENIKCSKILQPSRSSADTVILDNCYETAEEIQKDLESNGNNERNEKPVPISKSLRDCITYSEPLTPMLQEVLDDFTSEPEDSDRENQMEIVDRIPNNDKPEDTHQVPEPTSEIPNTKSVATDVAKNAKGLSAEVVEEVLAQELDGGNKSEMKSPNKKNQNIVETEDVTIIDLDPEISSIQAEKGTENRDDANGVTHTEDLVAQDSENTENVLLGNDSHTDTTVKSSGLNNSNSTVDASLPNNPEALKNKHSNNPIDKTNDNSQTAMEASNNVEHIQKGMKSSRKRSYSEDTAKNMEIKKKKRVMTPKPLLIKDKESTSESHLDKNEMISESVELKTTNEQSKVNDISKSDMIKSQVEKNACDLNKPSTSFDKSVEDKSNTDQKNNEIELPEIKNPCLQNVSLFDEHFNKSRYNMSESSDTEQNKKETKENKPEIPAPVPNVSNDVIMLKSHTESDDEVILPPNKKTRAGVLSTKNERDKAITNMFGFNSGGVTSKRKRQLSRRRRTISHNNVPQHNTAGVSNSSDWTSETDSETFVSPPRSRKNRPTRKYLKPKAGRILSLEEEGGLFVMYGKKIYPLVKDGKIVKNYLTYMPESDSEEGESYWKMKYVEEKKKAEELKKLLEHAKEPQPRNTNSPILQANPLRNSRCSHHQAVESTSDTGKEICVQETIKKEEPKAIPTIHPPEKIKIKFTKNNEEVHLEGHWPQIHPVLEQVVQIFHKEAEPTVSEPKPKMIVEPPDHPKEQSSSGLSTPVIITPVDPEVHEKVNKIETEIFKKIEELDKEGDHEPAPQDANVTKRPKVDRSRKSSSASVTNSHIKQGKMSNEPENTSAAAETENKNTDIAPKRQTRTQRNVLNETVNTNEAIQTRRSKQKRDSSDAHKVDDEEVRYMLPPKNKRQSLKSPATRKTNQKPQKSLSKSPEIRSSLDNFSVHSMDSTQGYQDSDVSPVRMELKKKKKLDVSSFVIKTRNSIRRSTRRKSHPYLYCDAYNDSSNSSADSVVKVISRDNSSLNTEAYKSESYQLLMPQKKNSIRQLEPIDETSQFGNKTYFIKHLESMRNNQTSDHQTNNLTNSGQITSDVGSSSNVSLPMSPELSVVENMSISKDIINSIEEYPTINEMQSNEVKELTLCNMFMISDVDVSIPLMQQDCGLESCNTITNEVSKDPKSLVTESLLSKIGTFNINDQVTPTDTLDKKLHDLLIDSAKKMSRTESAQNKESLMDVDVTNVEVPKKSKAKKRCSTPRKRKTSQKSIPPKVDPVVEEEHVESYSHSGRKSCPPQFQTLLCDENVLNEEIDIANTSIANKKPKGRKKKDIIRVKIQRPKNKKIQEKNRTKLAQNTSRISVFTDSGINDTESEVFLPMNDSVDLIHNHSETCLHANECVCDSVEFVDNSKSVITLDDSMQSGDNIWNIRPERNDDNKTPDLFCNNAQDVSFYTKTNTDNIENSSDTVYHSPLGTEASHNSLITEDLSDDPPQPAAQPTKWYLLSEDETTIKSHDPGSTMLSSGSFGSNLKQLFPIACAIPDLSTITEMSRENDDSKKPVLLDGLTTDDFNSQSIFD